MLVVQDDRYNCGLIDTSKHFFDFNSIEQELQEFDELTLVDDKQKTFDERVKGADSEKFKIAPLMAHRGHKREALQRVDAIQDGLYRQGSRLVYSMK